MKDDEHSPTRVAKLREAVAADPDSARAHYRLGTYLLGLRKNEEAEAELRRAVELDPEFSEAWVNLGGLLFARFDFAGSVEANGKALAIDDELVKAHYNKGLSHLYLGEAEKLVECFERVVDLDPSDAGGHYHLAVGLHAVGKSEVARKALAVAMGLGYSVPPQFIKALDNAKPGQPGKLPVLDSEPKD